MMQQYSVMLKKVEILDLKISFNHSKSHENNLSAILDHKQQLSMLSVLFR